MAQPNPVPRVNESETIGTSLKRWLTTFTKNISDGTVTKAVADLLTSGDTQQANTTTSQSTTSTTYVDMTAMTLTTAAGATRSYDIRFSCEHENTNADKIHSFAILIDGVQVVERETQSNKNAIRNVTSFGWTATIGPSKVVKIQFKTSANTCTAYRQTMAMRGLS